MDREKLVELLILGEQRGRGKIAGTAELARKLDKNQMTFLSGLLRNSGVLWSQIPLTFLVHPTLKVIFCLYQ